jgi:DMSO reductase anchor subunit
MTHYHDVMRESLFRKAMRDGLVTRVECRDRIKSGSHKHYTRETLLVMLDVMVGTIKSKAGRRRESLIRDVRIMSSYKRFRNSGMSREEALSTIVKQRGITIGISAIEKILAKYGIN